MGSHRRFQGKLGCTRLTNHRHFDYHKGRSILRYCQHTFSEQDSKMYPLRIVNYKDNDHSVEYFVHQHRTLSYKKQ